MSRCPTAVVCVLGALLAACGGGGSGSPQRILPRIALGDVTLGPGETSGVLPILLAGDGAMPVMVQFDLVTDPAVVRLSPDVVAVRDVGSLVAHEVAPGRLRVVFGDAASKTDPTTLPTGTVVQVPFELLGQDEAAVTVQQVLAATAAGEAAQIEPPAAPVTVGRR